MQMGWPDGILCYRFLAQLCLETLELPLWWH